MTKHKYIEFEFDIPGDFVSYLPPEHVEKYNKHIKSLADKLSADIDARILESILGERDPKANYRKS
ncbi:MULTISPECIES: hypothetical protein [Pseudomonas]|uniref:hypothetical protein n=1 Tax=Pseudomonas TaxID=286 RepID=UPI000A7052F2|nr:MULTISPECIES: hypothetical protein [Pseudomonas]MCS4061744.1 hypothetical protein [Pseudomonas putida]